MGNKVVGGNWFDGKVLKYITRHPNGVSVRKLKRKFSPAANPSLTYLLEKGYVTLSPLTYDPVSCEYLSTAVVTATPRGFYSIKNGEWNKKVIWYNDIKHILIGTVLGSALSAGIPYFITVILPKLYELLLKLLSAPN